MAETESKVVKLPRSGANKKSHDMWGVNVIGIGYAMIPSVLIRGQRRLKLTGMQLAVLLHIVDAWWNAEQNPWISKETIAERLNITGRQVQRINSSLEKAGFIRRVPKYDMRGSIISNEYDLTGLVKKLQKLAPEFATANATARKTRQDVQKPEFLRTKR